MEEVVEEKEGEDGRERCTMGEDGEDEEEDGENGEEEGQIGRWRCSR